MATRTLTEIQKMSPCGALIEDPTSPRYGQVVNKCPLADECGQTNFSCCVRKEGWRMAKFLAVGSTVGREKEDFRRFCLDRLGRFFLDEELQSAQLAPAMLEDLVGQTVGFALLLLEKGETTKILLPNGFTFSLDTAPMACKELEGRFENWDTSGEDVVVEVSPEAAKELIALGARRF